MRVDIVIVHVQRYRHGHEAYFVPPITGIHLAALTPARHLVRVIHQQVEPVDLDTDADIVALSFFSGFAAQAYHLADCLRARGKTVVAGGPHATFWPDETLEHCDSVVVGEAESVWPGLLDDAERGCLLPRYDGVQRSLEGIPTPRYDLLPEAFFLNRVVQATRGCPFSCSFCTVPALSPGLRVRPVDEVLRDLAYDEFPHWWQRKVAWFWDDNLTARRPYVKELLRRMTPLRRWWLTQASMDVAADSELLGLMERSGCIGVFFGLESFGAESLRHARKSQNRIDEYRACVNRLHSRGIAVMAGIIAGFDGDTPESIVAMADRLDEIGVDVPFISVLTPYRGTSLYARLEEDGRLLSDRDWTRFNGFNVTFRPARMEPEELLAAHRELWKHAFSPRRAGARVLRALPHLRPGALLLSAFMNGFYGLKQLRNNLPVDFSRVRRATLSDPHVTGGPSIPIPTHGNEHPADPHVPVELLDAAASRPAAIVQRTHGL